MRTIARGSWEIPRRSRVISFDDFRASKNPMTSKSVQAVVCNDDLLTEILLLLPYVSLHLLKNVSKRWYSLITSADFTLRWSHMHYNNHASGFFLQIADRERLGFHYNFVSLDTHIPSRISPFRTTFTGMDIEITQSCNGLLLCCTKDYKFYVYNPFISLNKMHTRRHDVSLKDCVVGATRMAFDPKKSPHYKVLSIRIINDDFIQLHTYSSETGSWSVCDTQFPSEPFRSFGSGVYWNNGIHWLNGVNRQPSYFRLDIEENPVLTKMQTPLTMEGKHLDWKLFVSCGCLLLLCKDDTNSYDYLNIYEMKNGPNGYSEWSIKYLVNLENINRRLGQRPSLSVWSIVLGQREEDSYMVLVLFGKVVQYNIELKTLRTLFDLGSASLRSCFEFIARV